MPLCRARRRGSLRPRPLETCPGRRPQADTEVRRLRVDPPSRRRRTPVTPTTTRPALSAAPGSSTLSARWVVTARLIAAARQAVTDHHRRPEFRRARLQSATIARQQDLAHLAEPIPVRATARLWIPLRQSATARILLTPGLHRPAYRCASRGSAGLPILVSGLRAARSGSRRAARPA